MGQFPHGLQDFQTMLQGCYVPSPADFTGAIPVGRKLITPKECFWICLFNIAYFIPFYLIQRNGIYLGLSDTRTIGLIELIICMASALAIKLVIGKFWPQQAYWK